MSNTLPPPTVRAATRHPRAVAILITGIVSITFLPVLGPVAWALGRSTLREIDAAPGRYTNRAMAQVGMILGITATVLLVVSVAVIVIVIVWATTGDGIKQYEEAIGPVAAALFDRW